MKKDFLFFDIDGVLINPLGYQHATRDTIAIIFSEFGLSNVSVLESDLLAFEAQGITSEWDMVPLFLLAWMEMSFRNFSPKDKIPDRKDLLDYLQTIPSTNFPLLEVIKSFGDGLKPGRAPAESILDEISLGKNKSKILPYVQKFADWMIKDFLSSTRNIKISETTRIFQNLVLGDLVFKEICGIAAKIKTDSYLIKYDEKLMDDFLFETLQEIVKQESVMFCAITARPSLMTKIGSIIPQSDHFFPEAELAMEKIGLNHLNLVGYGALKDLAERIGLNPDSFVKPSIIHALIAMAITCECTFDDILEFLILNRDWLSNPDYEIKGIQTIFPRWVFENKFVFHIFEDSNIGIKSVKALSSLLIQNGVDSSVVSYGIAKDINKIESLIKENARIFESINQAFSFYFETSKI